MKKHIIILLCQAAALLPMRAQQAAWLDSIETYNTGLRALRGETEALRQANRTALRLPDPEAEVAHYFGSPKGVPARTNVSVSQSLYWGVLTGRQRTLARAADRANEEAYRAQRQQVLADAGTKLVNLVYYNRLCAELQKRAALCEELLELYRKKEAAGEANAIEPQKIEVQAAIVRAGLSRAENERSALLLALQGLNGGRPVACADTLYDSDPLPALDEVLQRVTTAHPLVGQAEAAVGQSREQVKLAQAESWPELSVGFSGEYIKNNNYSGLSLGLSIPLWGNRRAEVRRRKAEQVARQLDVDDRRTQLRAAVCEQYASATALRATVDRLRTAIGAGTAPQLLRRALEEGQMALPEYIVELTFYYEARTALLEAERDAQLAHEAVTAMLR